MIGFETGMQKSFVMDSKTGTTYWVLAKIQITPENRCKLALQEKKASQPQRRNEKFDSQVRSRERPVLGCVTLGLYLRYYVSRLAHLTKCSIII